LGIPIHSNIITRKHSFIIMINGPLSRLFLFLTIPLISCSAIQSKSDIPPSPEKIASHEILAEDWAKEKSPISSLRGWEFLASKLKEQGIDDDTIISVFSNERMPLWTPIPFKVRPQESFSLYQKSNTLKARQNALSFYNEHKNFFLKSEQIHSVEGEIILAILQIETQCGKNTGNQPIVYWLSRLVSTGFPPNIQYNVRNSKEDPLPTYRELEERAEWLEEEFMPHLISLIRMSQDISVEPVTILGSHGGAIGLPQFLPGNIKKFGFDGDDDGVINLYNPADAILSVGNFLNHYGWKKGLSRSEKKNLILNYNRSNAYAETVLNMSEELKKQTR
jgi:membrane-bound lytic murein transglycosylase B